MALTDAQGAPAAKLDPKTNPTGHMYWDNPPLPLSEQTRSLFAFTNPERFPRSLDDAKLAEHIKQCRDKAYARTAYPCLGMFRFLEPGSRENASYPRAIAHVKEQEGRCILDMGCGYAQDVRAWLQDGVRGAQIVAADLLLDFVDDSFALFGDEKGRGHMDGVRIAECDIFNDAHVERLRALSTGGRGFDVIYAGSFLHLFNWEGQLQIAHQFAKLLSSAPGSAIFGRQSGMPSGKGGHYARQQYTGAQGENTKAPWRHDPESFKRLWDEQAPGAWDVDVRLQENHSWAGLTKEEMQKRQQADPARGFGVGLEFFVVRK